MVLNVTKYKSIAVSHRNTACPAYHYDNIHFESVLAYKYLDVHISCDISRIAQVEHVIQRLTTCAAFLK